MTRTAYGFKGSTGALLLLCLLVPDLAREGRAEEPAEGGGCAADCDASGDVDVADLVTLVRRSHSLPVDSPCDSADLDSSGTIDTDEVRTAVALDLSGCANPFEPDNTPQQAREIECEGGAVGAITAGDGDWFRIHVESAAAAVVIETLGMNGDSRLRLYDTNGVLIDHDDDSGVGYFSRLERVCGANALLAGDYFAEVTAFDADEEIDRYNLVLHCVSCGSPNWTPTPTVFVPSPTPLGTETPTPPPIEDDIYEYDDVFVHAHPIACGETQQRTLGPLDDVDSIRLELPQRSSLSIYVRSLSGFSYENLELLDDRGSSIAFQGSEIRRSCLQQGYAAGTYEVRVSGYPDEYEIGVACGPCEVDSPTPTATATPTRTASPHESSTRPSVSPTRTLTPTRTPSAGIVADVYEPDNSIASAKALPCGSNQSHTLTPNGDVDFVAITLDQLTGLLFEADIFDEVDLYRADGTLIDSAYFSINRSCGDNALPPGTYYAAVRGSSFAGERYGVSAICRPCGAPNPTATPSPTPTSPPATFAPDAYEPDGSPANAKRIKCGEAQHRTFTSGSDVDRLYFVLDETSELRIVADAGGLVRLTSPNGNQTVTFGAITRDCAFDPADPGTYSVTLEPYYGASEYTFELTCEPCGAPGRNPTPTSTSTPLLTRTPTRTIVADPFEPDNDRAHAHPIACGDVMQGTLAPAIDIDWRSFNVAAVSTVVIDLELDAPSGPAQIKVSDARENELADAYGPTRLRWNCGDDALDAGTYYLSVRSLYSERASYQLRVRCLPCDIPNPTRTPTITRTPTRTGTFTPTATRTQGPDLYEPDDDSTSASAIGCGASQPRSLLPAGDDDWVAFTLEAPSRVVLDTSGSSGGNTVLDLLDASLTAVASDDDSGPGAYSRLATNLATGSYFARVRSSSGIIAFYALRLECAPPVTPGNEPVCGNGSAEAGEGCDDGGNIGGDGCAPNCTSEQDVVLSLGGQFDYVSHATIQTGLFALLLNIQGSVLLTLGEPRDTEVVDASAATVYNPGDIPITILVDRNQGRIEPIQVPGLICACVRFVELRTCNGEAPLPASLSFCSGNASACQDEGDCVATFGDGVCGNGVIGCEGISNPDYIYSADSLTNESSFDRLPGQAESGALIDVAIAIGTIMDSGTCSVDETNPAKGFDGAPCTDDDPLESRGYASLQLQTTGHVEGRVLNVNNQLGKDVADLRQCGAVACMTTATGNMIACEQILAGNLAGLCLASVFPTLDQPTTGDIVVPVTFCGVAP